MPHVRIQVLCGPASVHPHRMGWSLATVPVEALSAAGSADSAARAIWRGEWYAWRLIGTNNHELGRSALSFPSYRLALDAFAELTEGLDRLVPQAVRDRPTGRWGWRLELDGAAVAISGRWYKRDQDSRLGAAKFLELSADAELADTVVTMADRRPVGLLSQAVRGGQ
ncbi:hypothetical protein [Dactylosporangium sp. CA-139066]|uniref:hypothetical protein n=1 Tax=Dactylosporangium sp. CA-139066 TaxID=3239930 RepID=UPI003D92A39C